MFVEQIPNLQYLKCRMEGAFCVYSMSLWKTERQKTRNSVINAAIDRLVDGRKPVTTCRQHVLLKRGTVLIFPELSLFTNGKRFCLSS
jgi:hypothetical protein